ncbi:recombinase RecT [Streptococcus suis]
MPATMIRKTALANALREAFPEDLGNMYTEDDGGETFDRIKQAEPVESREDVMARKMAQIEQMKQEQAQRQIDTSYPTDDVIDPDDEPAQGELLEDLEY